MKEKLVVVPGCGNCNFFTGVCEVMFDKTQKEIPTRARETRIDPPGAVEGPPSTVPGWVCSVSGDPKLQRDCSHFVSRTTADDMRDQNI